ncbi:MAG: serine hydrolase [Betaproteobacteria bacterium]|nr:serine hydrolase [Betaproteobacteria bacterium]
MTNFLLFSKRFPGSALLTGLALAAFIHTAWAAPAKPSPEELAAYQQAAAYSREHRGLSMVVVKDGQIVFEDYPDGHSAQDANLIYSGTKSFSCAIAVAAIEDQLLSFDEPVAQTITEWQADTQKARITIRQLLSLTSGIDSGRGLVHRVPSYADAVMRPMLYPPGTVFQYGPAPFQVFGELMQRKLAARGESPREYLTRRVLSPIGLEVDSWKTGPDGKPRLSGGASMPAREWAKYGQLILNHGRWNGRQILDKDLLAECFRGAGTNPGYGITFWLPVAGGTNSKGHSADQSAAKFKAIGVSDPIIKAAGAGGQKLYIIPSRNLVVVRQASHLPLWGRGYEDAEFLSPILKQQGQF